MADLFGIGVTTVNEHVLNVYREGEIDEEPTIRKFRIVRMEGGRQVAREVLHYNLDAIIAVGYRVSSKQGTLFRRWATGVLVQFATKGFVVDVERLKARGEQDRIAELREIIRDIRSSEANMYAELRNICAMCQDYEPSSDQAIRFYTRMQAKLFYAVTNRTPSEIQKSRADAKQPNMGLQTFAGREVTKRDAKVAKNYLAPGEIEELNRLTTLLLDIFDDQAKIGKLVRMSQAAELLDKQLHNLGRQVLTHGGNIDHRDAEATALRDTPNSTTSVVKPAKLPPMKSMRRSRQRTKHFRRLVGREERRPASGGSWETSLVARRCAAVGTLQWMTQ
ncbi:RhuM family protein [Phenylobacterium sp.]|uniref:RhuM family protein n=1 Tax=Phenylobacterium sp. TaxID=1871053 RepID=UPI0025CBA8C6|nr:RhuM family protein [Phenylobacterium sp.]